MCVSECICVSKHEHRERECIRMCARVHVCMRHQWSIRKLLALDKAGIRGVLWAADLGPLSCCLLLIGSDQDPLCGQMHSGSSEPSSQLWPTKA